MYNYRILLQYDGGRYDGWQRLGKDNSTNTIDENNSYNNEDGINY